MRLQPLQKLITKLGGWPIVEGDRWRQTSTSWWQLSAKLREIGIEPVLVADGRGLPVKAAECDKRRAHRVARLTAAAAAERELRPAVWKGTGRTTEAMVRAVRDAARRANVRFLDGGWGAPLEGAS